MQLEQAADQLYALPPEQFTAARNELARQAAAGDRALAAQIRDLRRPSLSAWAVNLLVRNRREQLQRLLDLGAELREAQHRLVGEALRELSAQRHKLVSALSREAGQLAKQAGHPLSEPARREVEGTLEAALADPDVAETVRAGVLAAAVSYAGLGSVSMTATPSRTQSRPKVTPSPPADDTRVALRDAEQRAAEARKSLQAEERQLTQAAKRRDATKKRVQDLEHQLVGAQQDEMQAAREVREGQRRRDAAVQAAEAADRRLGELRKKLGRAT